MTNEERHQREMSVNAHFAWAILFWGSAEVARKQGNLIPAAISYYYSVFHSGFSLLATDPTYPSESMVRMKHSKLEDWLAADMPINLMVKFSILREVREIINYLGVGEPHQKLRFVRGHQLQIVTGETNTSFPDMVNTVGEYSKEFIQHIFVELQQTGKKIAIRTPTGNEGSWLEDYLGEDAFLSIIPNFESRKDILTAAFSLLN